MEDAAMDANTKPGNPVLDMESKKRSRIASPQDEGSTAGLRMNCGIENINDAMQQLEHLIVHTLTSGDDTNLKCNREHALELLNAVSLEIIKATTKTLAQEEKITALLQQIVVLQTSKTPQTTMQNTYLEIAKNGDKAKQISEGKQLPVLQLPESQKHVPSELIIVIKAEKKGEIPSKQQQENFRTKLRDTLGIAITGEISAVRPTRHGGYLLIFRDSVNRDKAAWIIEENLVPSELINAPSKKMAKMICREIPEYITPEEVIKDLHGRHNPYLMNIPTNLQQATITPCKIGWIFNLSSPEAAAIHAQGSKVRYGFGREIKLEEFIPLQQCFRCCHFGHNAADCTSESERCRLCAASGHSGRACPQKDSKTTWKCYNCMRMNDIRGTQLPIDHAAAQLHKCSVAEQERERKREQLASTGIFVMPTNAKKYKSNTMPMRVSNRSTYEQSQRKDLSEASGRTPTASISSSSSYTRNTTNSDHESDGSKSKCNFSASTRTMSSSLSRNPANSFLSSSSFLSSASFITSSAFASTRSTCEGGLTSGLHNTRGRLRNNGKTESFGKVKGNNLKHNLGEGAIPPNKDNDEYKNKYSNIFKNSGGTNDEEVKDTTNNEKGKQRNENKNNNDWTVVGRGRGGRGKGRGRGNGLWNEGRNEAAECTDSAMDDES